MLEISLTDFVDFVISSGTPRVTKVRDLKYRPAYDPRFDFWKPLREAIEDFHKTGRPLQWLQQRATGQTDRKKQARYPAAFEGYERFLGHRSMAWFKPPAAPWSQSGVSVKVNPELGLKINGVPHVLKLYFKADKLSKNKVDVITHLMEVSLSQIAPKQAAMGIVDVPRGKLITPTVQVSGVAALLAGEAAALATMWAQV